MSILIEKKGDINKKILKSTDTFIIEGPADPIEFSDWFDVALPLCEARIEKLRIKEEKDRIKKEKAAKKK